MEQTSSGAMCRDSGMVQDSLLPFITFFVMFRYLSFSSHDTFTCLFFFLFLCCTFTVKSNSSPYLDIISCLYLVVILIGFIKLQLMLRQIKLFTYCFE